MTENQRKDRRRGLIAAGQRPIGARARLVTQAWFLPAFRVIEMVLLAIIGYFVGDAGLSSLAGLGGFLIFAYVIVFFTLELFFTKTIEDVEEVVEKRLRDSIVDEVEVARAARVRAETELDFHFEGRRFLSARLKKTTRGITDVVAMVAKGEGAAVALQTVKKRAIVDETLGELCSVLRATLAKQEGKSLSDVMFRATYMEVTGAKGGEELVYFGWCTPDGRAPRSQSEGKTYKRADGCAGLAWQRKRPVVEDKFEGPEWKDNYPDQRKQYASMACVPVVQGDTAGNDEVIGVITVDTNVPGYFGDKNNRSDEDVAGEKIGPYAEYIAFISSVEQLVGKVRNVVGAKGT